MAGILDFLTPFGTATAEGGILPGSGAMPAPTRINPTGDESLGPDTSLDGATPLNEGEPGSAAAVAGGVQPGLSAPGTGVPASPPGAGLSAPFLKSMPTHEDGASVLHASSTVRAKATEAYAFFRGRGWTDPQAKALTGRLLQEGMNPYAKGDKDKVTGEYTAFGIEQVRAERFSALKKFASDRGKPWTDFNTQLDYLDNELKHGLSSRPDLKQKGRAIANAYTIDDALTAVVPFWGPKYPEKEVGWMKQRLREVGML